MTVKRRLARVNGNVKAIVDGKEFTANGVVIDGVKQYPVTFMGESEMVPAIIRNGYMFRVITGEKYNDLKDWAFNNN